MWRGRMDRFFAGPVVAVVVIHDARYHTCKELAYIVAYGCPRDYFRGSKRYVYAATGAASEHARKPSHPLSFSCFCIPKSLYKVVSKAAVCEWVACRTNEICRRRNELRLSWGRETREKRGLHIYIYMYICILISI
ncbi:hypothetical protein TGMAS_417220 [Toxoplasma gondii MAS]|uniref:Uncharacterized protein n=1 Tax=Toxoplasma gondii MAS TaxID=943118 RepID=A0A086PJS7_TOXGO|nr:hypothetical protein TGMAS_417220 [Toxoplasma gondii MAS]